MTVEDTVTALSAKMYSSQIRKNSRGVVIFEFLRTLLSCTEPQNPTFIYLTLPTVISHNERRDTLSAFMTPVIALVQFWLVIEHYQATVNNLKVLRKFPSLPENDP